MLQNVGLPQQFARMKVVDQNHVNAKAVVAKVEEVQRQLNKREKSNCRLEAGNVEIKKFLNEITKQLERMSQQISREVQDEHMKKEIAEAVGKKRETMVVVAGGSNRQNLNSVEMFSPATLTWSLLQPMKEGRQLSSSVIYNNQLLVTGGFTNRGSFQSMETLSLNDVQIDQFIPWENFPAELPGRLYGHCTVVHNGRLIVIGGYDGDARECSEKITEISLVPPYTKKMLSNMPLGRFDHGVAMFGNKIYLLPVEKEHPLETTALSVFFCMTSVRMNVRS